MAFGEGPKRDSFAPRRAEKGRPRRRSWVSGPTKGTVEGREVARGVSFMVWSEPENWIRGKGAVLGVYRTRAIVGKALILLGIAIFVSEFLRLCTG